MQRVAGWMPRKGCVGYESVAVNARVRIIVALVVDALRVV
jgi:hypothetical protein